MNNFNSYLAILSAVDSGPIQRLDWPKSTVDVIYLVFVPKFSLFNFKYFNILKQIKEYATLIDPKCGFKKLRETVAEAQPPCIPHM